jgi:uncharacterized RDD family membrane protein YckC
MRGPDVVVHEESEHELVTGEAVALDLRPASFILRAAGAMIDFVVYFGGYLLLLLVIFTILTEVQPDQAMATAIAVATLVVCIVVIPVAVEIATHGKSLGRLAVGARIVRDDGGAIGFRHALIRGLTGVFEIFMTFGGLAATVALLNSRSKRLGDIVAGTYSQYERVSRYEPPVYGVPLPLTEWARTADVARMPDPLSRRIAQFLEQANGLTPQTRSRLAASLAHEASVFVSPVPQADAELFLAAVAAVRRDRELAAHALSARGLERLAPVLEGLPRGFPDRG